MSGRSVSIIGVPMDLGASRRGVDMGPSALRIARMGPRLRELGFQVKDRGNLEVQVRESLSEKTESKKIVAEIRQVAKRLGDMTYQVLKEGEIPLVMGGDHSIAMGSVSGIARFFNEQNQKVGIIWLDAHADINTPDTSPSGNIHGMPVAHIMGWGNPDLLSISEMRPMVDPSKIVLVGLRDLDMGEKERIKKEKINVFTMRDIDELGLKEVMRRSIQIATTGTAGFHVSFDMDWIDPSFAPGVGTPVSGGATYREGHLAMEMIHDSQKMISLEIAEVNPVLDTSNQTASLGVEMILSAFGKRIL